MTGLRHISVAAIVCCFIGCTTSTKGQEVGLPGVTAFCHNCLIPRCPLGFYCLWPNRRVKRLSVVACPCIKGPASDIDFVGDSTIATTEPPGVTIPSQRPGVCPNVAGVRRVCHPDLCQFDEQCPRLQKCCHDGCALACVNPIDPKPKPGFCPLIPKLVHTRRRKRCHPDLCLIDAQCPGREKCCHDGCALACGNPL